MARASGYENARDDLLQMIDAAARAHGRPPSVRQLAEHVSVGVATLHSYLQKMAEEGLVTWQPKHHRSLKITREGSQRLSSLAVPSA